LVALLEHWLAQHLPNVQPILYPGAGHSSLVQYHTLSGQHATLYLEDPDSSEQDRCKVDDLEASEQEASKALLLADSDKDALLAQLPRNASLGPCVSLNFQRWKPVVNT
jgi:hypothetical protein